MMAEIPDWAHQRAENEIAAHSSGYLAFAAYIAKHETPPVDPKLEAKTKAMRHALKKAGWGLNADGDIRRCIKDYESKLTELGAKP